MRGPGRARDANVPSKIRHLGTLSYSGTGLTTSAMPQSLRLEEPTRNNRVEIAIEEMHGHHLLNATYHLTHTKGIKSREFDAKRNSGVSVSHDWALTNE